jgi:hypothetical protein
LEGGDRWFKSTCPDHFVLLIPDRPTVGRPAVNRRIVIRIHVGEPAMLSTSRTCLSALQMTACGGAWSPRLPRTEETGGSNPPALTILQRSPDSLRDWARIPSPARGRCKRRGRDSCAQPRLRGKSHWGRPPDVRLSLFTTKPDADRHTYVRPFSKQQDEPQGFGYRS